MKVEYINPFIESVEELFSKMLKSEATRGTVGATRRGLNPKQVTALIGMSGKARGLVALSLPSKTAIAMVNRMLGSDSHVMDATVSDGISELVNIVAGQAKSKFPTDDGTPIDLSMPTVVRGSNYVVECPSDAVWLEVPFDSDLGDFTLRVTFRMNEN